MYTPVDEINRNPVCNPPASWIRDPLPFLDDIPKQVEEVFNYDYSKFNIFPKLNIVTVKPWIDNVPNPKVNDDVINCGKFDYRGSKKFTMPRWKKFVFENLNHKEAVLDRKRRFHIANDKYKGYKYEDRQSLRKADLLEWAMMNNLNVKKSMKIKDIIDLLMKMD